MIWKKSGAIYDGDWKDDHRCGFGTYSLSEGSGYRKVYSGGWKNDKRHVGVYDCETSRTPLTQGCRSQMEKWGTHSKGTFQRFTQV